MAELSFTPSSESLSSSFRVLYKTAPPIPLILTPFLSIIDSYTNFFFFLLQDNMCWFTFQCLYLFKKCELHETVNSFSTSVLPVPRKMPTMQWNLITHWVIERPPFPWVEGNGTPFQYSCLENPRDRGAWWPAVYGVTQGRTQLKWLSGSSSISLNLLGNNSNAFMLLSLGFSLCVCVEL